MKEMVVRTRQTFSSPARTVWPLLCNSRMDDSGALLFRLGVPQPVECRLPEGQGGVGSERECISDQGVVHQRILEWVPEKHLSFRMETTNMPFWSYVRDLTDSFDFKANRMGVTVTRTTHVGVKGRFQLVKKFALFFSLKQVHRYVFRNWVRLAKEGPISPSPIEHGSASTPAP
jgi:hypothetical protein